MAREMTKSENRTPRRSNGSEAMRPALVYRPDTDIYETEDHVVVLADMPGVAPGDVDVTLERRTLTIRGRGPDRRHDGYQRLYTEYGEGDFERVFTLSEEIDRDGIKARQKDGVLTLELPKAANARTKRINVEAE